MNTYTFSVTLEVTVEAFDEADARDVVHDAFGEGSTCGVEINRFKVDNERPRKNRG